MGEFMGKPDVEREFIDLEAESEQPQAIAKVDPKGILAEFEATSALIPKLVAASVRATRPQDWIAVGEKVYLQGTGVERVAALWGLVFGIPSVIREDTPDGEYSYIVTGSVVCRKTGVGYQGVVGGRSSRDPFFDEFDEPKPANFKDLPKSERDAWREAHRIPPDPMEVRKSAVTNWQTRGASMVTGMRGLTVADLESNGIKGVQKIEYGKGSRGGATISADIKAEQTKLFNEVLKRVGGEKMDALKLLKEITAGKDFGGFDSVAAMKFGWQFENAWKALRAHPVFGDNTEPGSRG
jgi:hypothetical protein